MTTTTTGRRGLVAAVAVMLAVVAAVFVVAVRMGPSAAGISGAAVTNRKLGEVSTLLENKMAFKAMKMNTKYELKSEQKTILRGGTIQVRHDAAAAMKSNIYAGIKDMKRVVLAGLLDKRRRLSEAVEDVRRKLPSVRVVKGAYGVMKGQIKTSILLAKSSILDPKADFNARHAAIHDLKYQIKQAITSERGIVETDDDDDDTTPRKLIEEIAQKMDKKQATKRAEAGTKSVKTSSASSSSSSSKKAAKADAKELEEEVKGDKKEVKELKKEVKADKKAIKADEEAVEEADKEADVIDHPPMKGSKLGQVTDEAPVASTKTSSSSKTSSSKTSSSKVSKKASSKN